MVTGMDGSRFRAWIIPDTIVRHYCKRIIKNVNEYVRVN